MTPERLRQIEELYHSAREREPSERAAFLAQACQGDEELRQELDELLAPDSSNDNILDRPAAHLPAGSAVAQLTTGTQIGPYKIEAELGAGGMGEVYRALDTRLKRTVAIKVAKENFGERFEREARAIAALNHPNICTLYDVGPNYLVMELIEGPTLAERIGRGPVPLEEALGIARQIADALEAAHEKGVVHRDLKPGNIKIKPDGIVKVLDFGLAKMAPFSAGDLSEEATATQTTRAGMIMGTAAYMSPEQAQGKPVDKRADIWAFGIVLYEMLTGRMPFAGETASETIAAVMMKEPDWEALPAITPGHVRDLLRRCLVREPRNRIRDIGDVRIALETVAALEDPRSVHEAQARQRAAVNVDRAYRIASLIVLIAAITLSIPTARYFRAAAPPELRLEITTPATPAPLEFALSPDGRYIVFIASGGGPQRLWLRALDKTDAQPITGTEGANYPFWAPDSRSIGFSAAGKVKRIDISGGPPQILANTSAARGGAWNSDGTILFTASLGPLSRVAASGGEPVAITRIDPPRQIQHVFPQFLPDGRHFLYYAVGVPEAAGIYFGSLDGGEPKRVAAADSTGAYLSPGMIAFVRQTNLIVQSFDLKRGELRGDPLRLAGPVASNGIVGYFGFSISANGQVAYRTGGEVLGQLKWYDRTGEAVAVAGTPDSAMLLYPELSPDGTYVAATRSIQNNSDIWLIDIVRNGLTRLTFDAAVEVAPLWSPDRTRIAFSSTKKGPYNLYLKPASGAGAEELVLETPDNTFAQDWSSNGQFILYGEADPKTGRDLWALPLTGTDRKPISIAKTAFEELNGQFSPDVHWVAYETNESGRFEIFVQPFPVANGKWQVSTGGGTQPRWRADGKELYFVAPEGKLMAASITTIPAFAAGTPVPLFPVTLPPGLGANRQEYAVARDGRFLVNQPVESSAIPPITLILNWKAKP
jgi:Tol biopolymer transport system component/predicted Ser/Thr protein kinase